MILQVVAGSFSRWFGCLVIVLLFGTSCTNQPRVDWNSRLGNFTFDQAVLELGPPDKSAKLTDGSTVAEWLTSRGYAPSSYHIHSGVGLYRNYPTTMWVDEYSSAPAPNWYLRLTFGPDSKLVSWKRVVK